MKAKHIPVFSLFLLVSSVLFGAWLLVSHNPDRINARDIFALKENKIDFKVPTKQEITAVKEIEKRLILIANPQLDQQPGVDLKLFGENKIVSQYNYRSEPSAVDMEFSYEITFTFVSSENRYCYINKKFYQQNDVMPDGGRISTIETNQVLIVKNNISKWIPVKPKTTPVKDPNDKE